MAGILFEGEGEFGSRWGSGAGLCEGSATASCAKSTIGDLRVSVCSPPGEVGAKRPRPFSRKVSMRVLVADDTEDIRELMVAWLRTQFGAEVLAVASGNQAQKILQTDHAFDCIVSDFNMPDGNGGELLRFLVQQQISIPFILCSTEPPSSYQAFNDVKPQAYVLKFEAIKALKPTLERLLPVQVKSGGATKIGAPAPSASPSSSPSAASTSAYFPLPLKRLKSFSERTLTPLFVPLAKNQFAKVFDAGQTWASPPQVKAPVEAMDPLWVQGSDMATYFAEWTAKVNFQIDKETVSTAASIKYSAEAVEWIQRVSQELGLTPELREVADTCARLAARAISRDPSFESLIRDLTLGDDSYLTSHCTALAHLACGLASQAGVQSEEKLYRLSLAALLHDLSLTNNEVARIQTQEEFRRRWGEFTPEQHDAFKRHPEASARLAAAHSGLPREVSDMILGHHERPDGTGFPQGKKAADIGELTALFILSNHILSALSDPVHEGQTIREILAAMQGAWRQGIFGDWLTRIEASQAPSRKAA